MTATPYVIHLVRHGNRPEAFERFIASYRRCDAGRDHRLVLLCKGFPSESALAPTLERLGGLPAQRIEVPDDGFDLTAYRRAAARLDATVGCFLNSNSVLLVDGWLDRLLSVLGSPVGIAGATGSWESVHSSVRYSLGIPGAYSRVFPDRAWHATQSSRVGGDPSIAPSSRLLSAPPLRPLRSALYVGTRLALFRPFPARHLRTNAFAIRFETLARLRIGTPRTKLRAWQLESGRGAVTDQVAAMGLRTLVVGRDGNGYEPSEWARSDTFWQAGQENLIVADNQTERYERADLELRRLLSGSAWGSQARPTAPTLSE